MISKTSLLFVGTIVALLAVGITVNDAYAWEPTEREQKVLDRHVNTLLKIEEKCTAAESNPILCQTLEERKFKLLFKLNSMGIYTDNQYPELDHLTPDYPNTRAAAQAGLQTIDEEDELGIAFSCSSPCDDDDHNDRSLYVLATYKEKLVWQGIWSYWEHNIGSGKNGIKTGQIADASYSDTWERTNNNDVVGYCKVGPNKDNTHADFTLGTIVSSASGAIYHSNVETESKYFNLFTPYHVDESRELNLFGGISTFCALQYVDVRP